jgi:two-component system nitrogen regulation response regulator NtrX
MVAYPWPGNVRELQNIVERLVLMTASEEIDVDDLPAQVVSPGREKLLRGLSSQKLAEARSAFEREFLEEKLRENDGNISRTAEVVGLARETLSRKLRSLGLSVEKTRNGG